MIQCHRRFLEDFFASLTYFPYRFKNLTGFPSTAAPVPNLLCSKTASVNLIPTNDFFFNYQRVFLCRVENDDSVDYVWHEVE